MIHIVFNHLRSIDKGTGGIRYEEDRLQELNMININNQGLLPSLIDGNDVSRTIVMHNIGGMEWKVTLSMESSSQNLLN